MKITATIEVEMPNGNKLAESVAVVPDSSADRIFNMRGLLEYWIMAPLNKAAQAMIDKVKLEAENEPTKLS